MNINKHHILTGITAAVLLGMAAFCWFSPAKESSISERRPLAQRPDLTLDALQNGSFMSDFESAAADQFPLRDAFRGMKALSSFYLFGQKDYNELYVYDGHLAKIEYPLNQPMLDHAAAHFLSIYENNLKNTDTNIYFSIVPDKSYFLAEEAGILRLDYDYLFQEMERQVPFATFIDITHLLEPDDYYRTDSHWKQENIVDIAQFLTAEMGIPAADVTYQTQTLDAPFYGVYHGQMALPGKPDTLHYLTNDALDKCIVTSYSTGLPKASVLYNFKKAAGKDPYELFLSGAEPLLTIENPNATSDRELILFRDSFGSSIAPLLAENYAKITLVDTRYMQSALLGSLIQFDSQDVLFLYSSSILNNSLALR